MYLSGADTGFGGGVPRNFVNDNMWLLRHSRRRRRLRGKVRRGAQWPPSVGGVWGASPKKILKIKCSRSDSEGTSADLRHIRNIFKGHFCKDHFNYSVHSVWGKVQ